MSQGGQILKGLGAILSQGLGSDCEEHGECGKVLSRGTCECRLRNLVPGRQWALNTYDLSILFCHHLVWHPKTSLPTTLSPEPSHLLPPSFYPSTRQGLRPTDPNLPMRSLRTGPGQA